jgi:hypothetical protein
VYCVKQRGVIQGASSAVHFFQDVGGSRGPDEGSRAFVMTVDVSADGHDEFFQFTEYATPEPILSQVAKETFHHVQPGRASGSEVQMKARMPRQLPGQLAGKSVARYQ